MESVIMGTLDGGEQQVAFEIKDVKRIVSSRNAKVIPSPLGKVCLEVDGQVLAVEEPVSPQDIKEYFVILRSGLAFNLNEYCLLFGVKQIEDKLLWGLDAAGNPHVCSWVRTQDGEGSCAHEPTMADLDQKLMAVNSTLLELKDMKEVVVKLKNGEFFEALAMEVSGKIREVAQDLIDFRNDIQNRIEPDIVEMAAKDIPEASNQLEGINETLEESTMKIMDINDEQIGLVEGQWARLGGLLADMEAGRVPPEGTLEILKEQWECLGKIKDLSMRMMEPLSFQDLVGQRIQKIIKLVKAMEVRIEDIILSFGLKIQKHRMNPERSFEDLQREVERVKSDLKGPQRQGEGLDQSQIDDLLATL